ncbi:hypothetical protein Pmani_001195 [Petrolisthes manimaculis]|uniref:Uncharacterized protein n=1 Tax=Petrolisthes manimaculis TaxID=1843537 RepID=A0AAE1QNA0_9EUCA|nr:hypothetical protein Pmani_001195 [Petrolisthes manimaculis]
MELNTSERTDGSERELENSSQEPTPTLNRANTHSKENRCPPCGVPQGEPLVVAPEWKSTPSGFRDVKSVRVGVDS